MSLQDENEIVINSHQDFYIKVPSKKSAGYKWNLKFDDRYISLLDEKFLSDSDRFGASSIQQLHFKAKKKGLTKIILIYKRPWQDNILKKKEYKVIIK